MGRYVTAVLLAALTVAGLAGPAPAGEAATQPAVTAKAPAKAPTTRVYLRRAKPASSVDGELARKVYADCVEGKFWAKWACLLAGLALVGVIWTGWSMRTLAKNQVQIAKMIQELRLRQAE